MHRRRGVQSADGRDRPGRPSARPCSPSAPTSSADLGEAIQAPGQMTYGSQAAAATQVFEQQRDLALRDRSTQQLELVDAALARLDGGTFGTCLRCGKPIAPARLEALPWAAHCIECQAIVDRERR